MMLHLFGHLGIKDSCYYQEQTQQRRDFLLKIKINFLKVPFQIT